MGSERHTAIGSHDGRVGRRDVAGVRQAVAEDVDLGVTGAGQGGEYQRGGQGEAAQVRPKFNFHIGSLQVG